MEYYDIHTHILPGVDDGSDSIEETREMLRQAVDEGVKHIIATPHYDSASRHNPTEEALQEALGRTRELAAEVDASLTITLGNELLHSSGIVRDLQSGRAHTIGDTRYILVEFLPGDSYTHIYQGIREYVLHGYIPIIAHMERYQSLVKNYSGIRDLREVGAYLQMNVRSLEGGLLHRKAAYHRSLVTEGYIQFLGSDCHGSNARSPIMRSGLGAIRKKMSDERYMQLVHGNPKTMLADNYL